MLTLFLVTFVALFICFGVYLVYANVSKPKKWPFNTTKVVKKEKQPSGAMMYVQHSESNSGMSTGMSILVMIIFIAIIALIIVGAYFSIKMSMKRYEIAGEAIRRGNTGAATAVLAPEIGSGVGSALGGLFGSKHIYSQSQS